MAVNAWKEKQPQIQFSRETYDSSIRLRRLKAAITRKICFFYWTKTPEDCDKLDSNLKLHKKGNTFKDKKTLQEKYSKTSSKSTGFSLIAWTRHCAKTESLNFEKLKDSFIGFDIFFITDISTDSFIYRTALSYLLTSFS